MFRLQNVPVGKSHAAANQLVAPADMSQQSEQLKARLSKRNQSYSPTTNRSVLEAKRNMNESDRNNKPHMTRIANAAEDVQSTVQIYRNEDTEAVNLMMASSAALGHGAEARAGGGKSGKRKQQNWDIV